MILSSETWAYVQALLVNGTVALGGHYLYVPFSSPENGIHIHAYFVEFFIKTKIKSCTCFINYTTLHMDNGSSLFLIHE